MEAIPETKPQAGPEGLADTFVKTMILWFVFWKFVPPRCFWAASCSSFYCPNITSEEVFALNY